MTNKLEHAVILHSRKYKDSSMLLHLWLPTQGRLNAVARIGSGKNSKKNHALYQPFNLLNIEVKLAKSSDALANIRTLELEKSYPMGSYLSQLSRLYLNELLYWLLPQDHHDEALFNSYLSVVRELVSDDVSRLLRYFELQLLESLGYGFQTERDESNILIQSNAFYTMAPLSAFHQVPANYGISGQYILQLQQPVSSWNDHTLKVLRKLIRINLDACLHGRPLKTRELLRNSQGESATV